GKPGRLFRAVHGGVHLAKDWYVARRPGICRSRALDGCDPCVASSESCECPGTCRSESPSMNRDPSSGSNSREEMQRMCVNRRELLYGMALACAPFMVPVLALGQENHVSLRIDGARLRKRLEGLSVYGRPEGGTFADGVSRVAYSDADVGG